jgi:outer membrane immunogenic protein
MLRLPVVGAGLLSIAGFTGAASAADVPAQTYIRPPAFVAPSYDWSGLFLGVNGGGASSHECYALASAPGLVGTANEGCHNADGALVGGQIGYRWQRAAWIFGVEALGDHADLKGSNTSLTALIPYTNQTKVDAIGLLTGQIGYAWHNALPYIKGGVAFTENNYTSVFPVGNAFAAAGIPFNASGDLRWGGMVGVGVEFGLAPNWSVAVEYDHLFMGSQNVVFPATATALGRGDTISQNIDMATLRVNYRFDGPLTSW